MNAQQQFATLAEKHAARMYRIAYSLLRNAHDAEDAVQECLLKLFRLGGWRDANNQKAFIARAVWRCALDRLPRGDFIEATEAVLPAHADLNPEQHTLKLSQTEHLHRLIDALPLDLRQPLLLSGFEDLNSSEIALILDIPDGTVRTRLKRAREELKRRWNETEERRQRDER